MSEKLSSARGAGRSLVRRIAPVAVAVAALVYAVHGIELSQLRLALQRAPLGIFLVFSAGMAIANCGADTLAMYYVFRGFGLRLRFVELYTIRAATYTLAVINYHAGQLGIIGFLHRVTRVPLSRASAIILFIVGVWVALLMIFATFGAVLGGPKGRALMPVLSLFAIGLAVYAVLLRWPPRFLRTPPPAYVDHGQGPEARLPRLRRRAFSIVSKLWAPLHEAGISGHLRALVVRLPHLAVLLIWHFVALRCFRVEVPFHLAMLYLPVVFAVAALPISVQGLGTAQVVAKYYFRDFAVGSGGDEAVLAYSLSMTAIATASNLILGLLFLERGARLGLSMASGEADEIESQMESESESAAAAAEATESGPPQKNAESTDNCNPPEDAGSSVRSVIYTNS
jgi:hypothetical protein